MNSFIEYVETVLDNFSTKEFCSIDALVLSQLSYVNIDDMAPGLEQLSEPGLAEESPYVRIGDLLKAEFFDPMLKGLFFPHNNKKLLFALAASPRFRDVKVRYYTNKLDYKEETQFSAVTFSLCDQTTFVAFRGTDLNLIGWKEDFNMAFKCPVPAQEEGRIYLNTVGNKTLGGLRVGGHSKGGNIAVYSSMKCNLEIQDRIINIYSFDGPGFKDSIFHDPGFLRIEDRVIKILPESSVIGMLLQTHEKYKVVRSSQWGIIQHDPFSWVINNGDFHYVKNVSNSSISLNKTINQWLNTLCDDERERYVDALYHAIESTNITSINDFSDIKINEITSILKSIKNIDPETKKFLSTTIRELTVLYFKNINLRSN